PVEDVTAVRSEDAHAGAELDDHGAMITGADLDLLAGRRRRRRDGRRVDRVASVQTVTLSRRARNGSSRLWNRLLCCRERFRDVLERLAPGVDAEGDLDDPPENHDAGADEVADEEARRARAVADQRAVEGRPHSAEDLRDGEEDGDRLGPD